MKYASLFGILCLVLMAATCKQPSKLEAQLTGKTWLHSFEDDQNDLTVFRPNTFNFPPSRGRTGFALEPGGVIIRYDIAPTDGLEEHTGKWTLNDDKTIQVTLDEEDINDRQYRLEIVSLKDDVLKVRQHFQNR
ncbi:hypothetical protein [Pontibacter arcticus]|uniref:Lipocalin-like domain-containing protein n=1 Tax=Pontibacter arcticus TaxID=2080288 RepID=A0A364RJJ2_9BACT|nr:hypothetical protein [Pontibacter arcticus]RAU84477.1 hypothetical protein DP923_01145 [Pontibacter arcticus]